MRSRTKKWMKISDLNASHLPGNRNCVYRATILIKPCIRSTRLTAHGKNGFAEIHKNLARYSSGHSWVNYLNLNGRASVYLIAFLVSHYDAPPRSAAAARGPQRGRCVSTPPLRSLKCYARHTLRREGSRLCNQDGQARERLDYGLLFAAKVVQD